jgi:hypothetical protein
MRAVFERRGIGLDALRLAMFVHEWAMLEAELGHRIGIEHYAVHGPDSRQTAYRRLRLFRETFATELGEEATPAALIVWPDGLPLPERAKADSFGLAVPVTP